jgi:hypothetical protein
MFIHSTPYTFQQEKKRATHGGGGEERPQQWWQLNSKHDYRVQEETNLKDIIDMQLY